MHLAKRNILVQTFTLLVLLLVTTVASAVPQITQLNDSQALHGLSSVKAVFMLDVNNASRLSHILNVVEKTDKGVRAQGVKPHIIVVIIGPAVAFLTRDRRGIPYMDQRAVATVQKSIHKLKSLGIRTEACGVALKGMNIAPADVIPDVHPVGNGFISAIGYQARGYELVPVY